MIYYKKVGKGKPVFLIHGFPNDHTTWNNIVPELSSKYQVFMPDLPGAGSSSFLNELMTIEAMASQIYQIFDHENLEKAVMVGHSMGGYVSANFANLFPDRLAGLSLLHSSAGKDSEEKRAFREKGIKLMRKGDLEKNAFLKGMANNLFFPEFAENNLSIVQSIIDNGNALSTEALTTFYTAIKERIDQTESLKNLKFPVQFIIGNDDQVINKEEMLQQSHLAEISDVQLYQSCGHMSMFEYPEKLTDDLIRFFDFSFQL